jgi:glycosyltransferase involved in cell wall biosynthesis
VGAVVNNNPDFDRQVKLAKGNNQILFPGRISEVEALVNACDIGVLFSNISIHGEGISNSIIEYMALGKPVIVDDCGGTNEFVIEEENGFFTTNRTIEDVGNLIIDLFRNPQKRKEIGNKAKDTVMSMFTLERMGVEFERLYKEIYNS